MNYLNVGMAHYQLRACSLYGFSLFEIYCPLEILTLLVHLLNEGNQPGGF